MVEMINKNDIFFQGGRGPMVLTVCGVLLWFAVQSWERVANQRSDMTGKLEIGAGTEGSTTPVSKESFRSGPTSSRTLPEFDEFGGLKAVRSPHAGTGYFRLEKFGNRWLLVTPAGHAFWYLGVAASGGGPGKDETGRTYQDYMRTKYGSGESGYVVWEKQIKERMLSWGFNSLGMFESPLLRAHGTMGRKPTKPFMPFLHNHVLFAKNSMTNRGNYIAGPVKNIREGVQNGGIFPDVFDPGFEKYALAAMKADTQSVTDGLQAERDSPWIIAELSDESDDFNGFNSTSAPHPGWAALATAPYQPNPKYSDPKVYTKFALRDFLQKKYNGNLAGLNATWGSSYTSWDSDGGYSAGTGLLDEDGRKHKWMGSQWGLRGEAPAMQKDLDDFLYLISQRYFRVCHDAIRSVDKNHLYFGMVSLTVDTPPPVILGAKDYVDALVVGLQHIDQRTPMKDKPPVPDFYNLVQKPILSASLFITAEPDSGLYSFKKPDPQYFATFDTQEERAKFYANYLQKLLNLRGDDGIYPVIGFHWWALSDDWGAHINFGLVTLRDNAYDGKEDTARPGTDPRGFSMGSEDRNYGDFLTGASNANIEVMGQLIKESAR
jgi:hypothetical protein